MLKAACRASTVPSILQGDAMEPGAPLKATSPPINWHARLFVRQEFPPPSPGSVLLVESSEGGGSRRRHCFFRMP